MRAGRRHADEAQPQLLRRRLGLGVEVVDDLHVVGDEPDGHHHHRRHTVGGELLEVVVDVGLEPRGARRAGPRAVDELPRQALVPRLESGHHEARGLEVLVAVGADTRAAARVVHRVGDRVGHEDDVRVVRCVGERSPRVLHERRHEAGVVEGQPQSTELDVEALGRVGEVLAVLTAARVRGVRTREEVGGVPDAVGHHLLESVAQVRVPVPVAPVDGQVDVARRELTLERRDDLPVEVVDRAATAEQEVVLPHLLQPLARDALADGHVLQERDHVVGLLGTTEGDVEECIEGADVHAVIVPRTASTRGAAGGGGRCWCAAADGRGLAAALPAEVLPCCCAAAGGIDPAGALPQRSLGVVSERASTGRLASALVWGLGLRVGAGVDARFCVGDGIPS